MKHNTLLKAFLFFLILLLPCVVFGQTPIYRSVGPGNTTDLNIGGRTVTIAGTTATFSGPMPDNVGVGDVLKYNGSNLAFIHGRNSAIEYEVKNEIGANPEACSNAAVEIYRAYTSLSNASTGKVNSAIGVDFDTWTGGRNLVTNNESWNITCYADGTDGPSTAKFTEAWITDIGHWITIYAPVEPSEVGTSQRHPGKWDETKYLISYNGGIGIWAANNGFISIDGLQLEAHVSSGMDIAILGQGGSGSFNVSNCIIRCESSPDIGNSFGIDNATMSGHVRNCIISGFNAGGIAQTSQGSYTYNCTVVNCGTYGFLRGTVKNCISQGCSNGFDAVGGNSDYSISDVAADAPGVHSKSGVTVAFMDEANMDYRLSEVDDEAIDAGTDLSADPNFPFSDDIEGEERLGRIWDIGADEAPGGAVPTTTTSSGSTTTTSANGCTAEKVYGESSEEVELLRSFRDTILRKTSEGREIIALYYLWSPTVVAAMDKDDEFRADVKRFIDDILPLIKKDLE